jgi:hypothetical protein
VRIALIIAAITCALLDLPAQASVAQQVPRATARFIDSLLPHLEGYNDRRPRVLASDVLPVTINGLHVEVAAAVAPRSASETAALAAQLGAQVAVAEDTIAVVNGQPRGTTGLLIRLGEPRIVGDSAVMVFALHSRGTTGRMLPGFLNRYVVVLRRRGEVWAVESYGKANQDRVPKLTYIQP